MMSPYNHLRDALNAATDAVIAEPWWPYRRVIHTHTRKRPDRPIIGRYSGASVVHLMATRG